MHLEKEYEVEFTEDDLLDNSISSVDGLACLVHSKV
jgi:acyl carrier protein